MQYLEDVDSSSLCVPPAPYSQMYSGSLSQGVSSPHPVELDCAAVICAPGVVVEVVKWLRNVPDMLQSCSPSSCSLARFLGTGALSFARKSSLTAEELAQYKRPSYFHY